tara:strand:+ start:113 stop:538 length:426 start_codon:yes stop_codon:yes gene_type:complete
MSIKLLLLRSGEEIITEVQEMVNPETKEPMGYHLHKPFRLEIVSDDESGIVFNREKGYQLHWFPWAPLSKDRDFFLPSGHVLTAYDPLDSISYQYTAAIKEDVYEKNFKEHEAMISGEVGELDMEKMFEDAERAIEEDCEP